MTVSGSFPQIGRQFVKWHGPKINIDYDEVARKRGDALAERDQRIKTVDTHLAMVDEHYAKREASPSARAAARGPQSYAFPGHQGRLGEIGGEPVEPPTKAPEKAIAEHSEAEKAARVSEIAKQLGIPMQPGRQVATWTNKTHLPKAEGGQGTLFAPRKYR